MMVMNAEKTNTFCIGIVGVFIQIIKRCWRCMTLSSLSDGTNDCLYFGKPFSHGISSKATKQHERRLEVGVRATSVVTTIVYTLLKTSRNH